MFDERIFIKALSTRPEDTKKFIDTFSPSWLREAPLIPILRELFLFTKEHGIPPSINTLHKVLQEKEPEVYELRHKYVLKDLEDTPTPDLSDVIYTLDKARDVSITESFRVMTQAGDFVRHQQNYDGQDIVKSIYKWLTTFYQVEEDQTLDIKSAIEQLVKNCSTRKRERIATGIVPIDKWTDGGLRSRMLGILMAPTGHGKSAALLNMTYHMTIIEDLRVWFVTNELTMDEQTERFLSRLQNIDMKIVQDDPRRATGDIGQFWKIGLQNRLLFTSVNREISTLDLETLLLREVQLNGWKPDVLILDFMERMKPVDKGYDRAKEWHWLGAISKDIVRFAKKHDMLVWSAAQTNRAGLNPEHRVIKMEYGQGSIRHFQESAAVIGMLREKEIGLDRTMMKFFNIKMRHSEQTDEFEFVEVDLAKMLITQNTVKDTTVKVDRDAIKSDTAHITEPDKFTGKFNKKKRKRKDNS